MEGDALIQAILRILVDCQIASLENIAKGHGGNLTADNGDSAGFLRFVLIVGLLSDGVDAGSKVVDLEFTVSVGGHGLTETLAGDGEGNALHNTVLGGLDDLCTAEAHIQLA